VNKIFGFLIFILLISIPAKADWVNFSGAENALNIAEININDDHVKLILEIYVRNLEVFEALVPDDLFSKPILGRPPHIHANVFPGRLMTRECFTLSLFTHSRKNRHL
jgi:hypothetical protein